MAGKKKRDFPHACATINRGKVARVSTGALEIAIQPNEPMAKEDLTEIKNDLRWHWRTIVSACAIATAVFLFVLGWLFIEMPEEKRQDRIQSGKDTELAVGKQINPLSIEVAKISAKLDLLEGGSRNQLPELFRQSLDNPDRRFGISKVGALAEVATDKKIDADLPPVRSVIESVLATGGELSEQSWMATGKLLNYLSFLDASRSPKPAVAATHGPTPGLSEKAFNLIQSTGATFFFWGTAKPMQGAIAVGIGQIGDAKMDQEKNCPLHGGCVGWAMVDGVGHLGIDLDGNFFQNSIISRAQIRYAGGPVILKNVYFVDCTFEIRRSENGVLFAKAFASSPSITFEPS